MQRDARPPTPGARPAWRNLGAGCLAALLCLSPLLPGGLLPVARADSEAQETPAPSEALEIPASPATPEPQAVAQSPAPEATPAIREVGEAPEGPALATLPAVPALRPFSPEAAPFDAPSRYELARGALTYFVRQQGLFPGQAVYLLPAPMWWTSQGLEEEAEVEAAAAEGRRWDLRVPGSLPIYLLAGVDPSDWLDPLGTTVRVDGVSLPDLDRYVHRGVPAIAGGRLRDVAGLDLVFAPPPAGKYRLEVQAPLPVGGVSTLVYDLTVAEPDALGPRLLQAGDGALYAVLGPERLRVPDGLALQAFGFTMADAVPAGPETLAAIPEGDPLPALREGMLVRAPGTTAVFRLQGGRRVRMRGIPETRAMEINGPLLNGIPPLLQDGMVVQGGTPDVFLVEEGQLRKVPDWVWLLMRGYRPEDAIRVPDRLLYTLPQNSPQWVQPGGAWHDAFFTSEVLARTMPYRVFLPPSYDTPAGAGRRYPVVYLLHGMSGRYDEWTGYGVEEVANQLLADGEIPEMILVLPQGGLGYWMNQDGPGAPQWAEFVAVDLVRHVDAAYRTIPRREARAVGGLSMGGHGAIQLALTYPDVFGVAGAHSPSIRGRESAPAYFGADGAAFARRDPISLVRQTDLAAPPRIWIDVGSDDPWRPAAEVLREALEEKGWAPEWHVFPGEHDGWYWGDHLWEYLPFYGDAFRANGVAP